MSEGAGLKSTDVVELRVHGIFGMPAEKMLDWPIVVRVAGDDSAGFYRVRPGFGDTRGSGGVILEAYQWGNLTAGRAARTLLLLLLLPFMFSNVAFWLRPPGRRGRAVIVLCHLLAATITGMFVLSMVGSSMDLVGWQCTPYRGCVVDRQYIAWLSQIPMGPRLALLAVIPLLAIRFVWWIGARSARSFEGFQRLAEDLGPPDSDPDARRGPRAGDRLDAPGFWRHEPVVSRIRTIHVCIAFAVLDLSLLTALATPHWTVMGGTLVAANAAQLVAGPVLLCMPALTTARRKPIRPDASTRALRNSTVVLTVLTLAYAAIPRRVGPVRGGLPAFSLTVSGLIVTQVAILAVLVVVTLVERRQSVHNRGSFYQGLGTPVFGSIAVGLAGLFSTALIYRVADILDRGRIPSPTRPRPPGVAPLDPPTSYRWAALSGVTVILVVTIAGLTRQRLTRRRQLNAAERLAAADFPDPPPQARQRLSAVRDAIRQARVPEQLALFVVVYFALSFITLTFTALDLAGVGPMELASRIAGQNSPLVRIAAYLTDVGTYSVGLLVFGVVVVGLLAFTSAQVRRLVGTLWDLGTFWPRAVHPFAPPSYAERAVPELARRITGLTQVGKVVISGHSQGSVLVAAAILQLPRRTLRRVALVTHGSPIHRLYARLSPAYLGQDVLYEIGDRVGWRWRNLWRDTDPIGGPIFPTDSPEAAQSAGTVPNATGAGSPITPTAPASLVDIRLRDPRAITVDPMDTVPPPIERHWPYHTHPAYARAIAELADLQRNQSE